MRVRVVTPAPAGSRRGNRVSAERWARVLRGLGHRVRVEETLSQGPFDLLVALHARKGAAAVLRSRREAPRRPIVLALTGTDIYPRLRSKAALRALEAADVLVALQPLARLAVPKGVRGKVRVVFQSARRPRGRRPPPLSGFPVCVLGHLRPVKDPFRAALAARRMPSDSRVRVLHAGAALSKGMARRARAEAARNPRYAWLGDLPRPRALSLLARCRLLVLPSKSEGGAQVIGEAVVLGVPVLASRVAGSVGLLGRSYPGWFRVGDTAGLARRLRRAERDPAFLAQLARACARCAPQFSPARERGAWRAILAEVVRSRRG